ncbi:mCG147065 [Mus musculus]|nr:mCG147065 [Mus musculus]
MHPALETLLIRFSRCIQEVNQARKLFQSNMLERANIAQDYIHFFYHFLIFL